MNEYTAMFSATIMGLFFGTLMRHWWYFLITSSLLVTYLIYCEVRDSKPKRKGKE